MVEVRLACEVVRTLPVARLGRRERLVDELARAHDLGARALHLPVVRARRSGRHEGGEQEEGDDDSTH